MSCLSLDSVRFEIPNVEPPILEDIAFELNDGERLTLLGPSGSGKTTILRLIVRLEERTGGEIRVDGEAIEDIPVRVLRRRVALVAQEPSLLGLTVRENLDLAQELAGTATNGLPPYEDLLAWVELPPEVLDRGARELSVGQKQRVTLARALVAQPKVLLLDEPTSALDPGSEAGIADLLRRISDELGTGVLTVTHSPQLAAALGGWGVFLRGGRIEDSGEMTALLARDRGSLISQFLNGHLREAP